MLASPRGAQTAVEAFDQAVLLRMRRIRKQSGGLFSRRLAGVDVVPGHAGIARLLPGRRLLSIAVRAFEDRRAGELGAPPQENDPPDRFLIFVDR